MRNIFSYQYGSVFTGKEIKDYLIYRANKGYSLAGYNQYFRCKDNRLYVLTEQLRTSENKPRRKAFERVYLDNVGKRTMRPT